MYPYPPIYPQPFDCRAPHPNRPAPPCPWDLSPAGMCATVLGIDACGGVIVRLTREPDPCDRDRRDRRPCRCR